MREAPEEAGIGLKLEEAVTSAVYEALRDGPSVFLLQVLDTNNLTWT